MQLLEEIHYQKNSDWKNRRAGIAIQLQEFIPGRTIYLYQDFEGFLEGLALTVAYRTWSVDTGKICRVIESCGENFRTKVIYAIQFPFRCCIVESTYLSLYWECVGL